MNFLEKIKSKARTEMNSDSFLSSQKVKRKGIELITFVSDIHGPRSPCVFDCNHRLIYHNLLENASKINETEIKSNLKSLKEKSKKLLKMHYNQTCIRLNLIIILFLLNNISDYYIFENQNIKRS